MCYAEIGRKTTSHWFIHLLTYVPTSFRVCYAGLIGSRLLCFFRHFAGPGLDDYIYIRWFIRLASYLPIYYMDR